MLFRSFVIRLRDNADYVVLEEKPLTEKGMAEGIQKDLIVRLGSQNNLDEPYRAMDALTKSIMHESLLETYDRTKVTIFFITHDLEEAIFLGDKVHVVTTRPCRLKKTVSVNIPRPRSYETQSSEAFRLLMEEVNEAVHEEAIKAFQSGEREMA